MIPTLPKRIMIIRHAEKPDVGPKLSPIGKSRAYALAQHAHLFGGINLHSIIAAGDTKESSRPRETVKKLAKKLDLPIDTRYMGPEYKDLAQHLLHSKQYFAQNILVAWHHGCIPELIDALTSYHDHKYTIESNKTSCAPIKNGKWNEDVFDRIIYLEYVQDPLRDTVAICNVTSVPQRLLFGDQIN